MRVHHLLFNSQPLKLRCSSRRCFSFAARAAGGATRTAAGVCGRCLRATRAAAACC
jgi:hypothetical protein